MKKVNNNNKSSARKKLIPAAGSLMVSAAMLSTSTFAWFTMSREVEVKNIRMTATTPEDIQISLGAICKTAGTTPAVENDGVSLSESSGFLTWDTGKTNADNGTVKAPTTNGWDWSNSADISAYYDIGRLIPASSHDGTEIFFTPDANGVGKTVKGNATYIKATNKLTALADANTSTATGVNKTYEATLHALIGERAETADTGKDAWAKTGYTQAAKYNVTNDDGYYVDIPIWLRSSSNNAINLSVDGYVIPGSVADETNGDLQTQLELYRAVRVAFLDGEDVTATAADAGGAVGCSAGDPAVAPAAEGKYNNILPLKDAWVSTAGTTLVSATPVKTDTTKYTTANLLASNTPFATSNPSILDSLNYKRATVGNASMADTDLYGVSALEAEATATDGSKYTPAKYTKYDALTPTSADSGWSTVATVAGSTTGGQYGDAKKLIIRVWLDGEDKECWNDNAGQDWNIALKFTKIESGS